MNSVRSRKWLVLLGAALLLVIAGASYQVQAESLVPQTFQPPKSLEAGYVPGEVLVKFKESPATFRGKPSRQHLTSVTGASATEFTAALPTRAQAALERVQGRVLRAHPNIGALRVKLPAHLTVSQAIDTLYRSGAVEYAVPNGLLKLQATPNDPGQQWSLATIKAPEAWDIITGGPTIVAVVDSGVDYHHEDLAANMWVNTAEIPGNSTDDDGNNFVDDYYGINTSTTPSTGDPMDLHGHGTAIAGIIGAVGNNGKGIAGINWQTKVMALKFWTGSGGTVDNAVTCINYALSKKGNTPLVITLGWTQATNTYYNPLHDSLRIAQDSGALVVASAGNDDSDNDIFPNFPSSYNHDVKDFPVVSTANITMDNIISVGSSDNLDKKDTYSSYGMATVDLFAPGKNILTPTCGAPENKYVNWTGTSLAAAHVAGACALVWNRYPEKDWKQIKALILNGVEDGEALDFRTICVTEGRLNLLNSLSPAIENAPAVFSIFEVTPATGDPALVPGRADTGDTIVITGVNFGDGGTISFLGSNFPADNIVSWSNEKIVATVPAGLPKGTSRLQVTNSANGLTSRGACFSNISRERQVGSLNLARGLAASAQVGTDVWVIGGRTYWGIVPHVEKYSLETNHAVIDSDWVMPLPVSNAGAAAIGTKIYVVGGCTEDSATNAIPVPNLQIFDTATLTWAEGPPLPKALMQCAVISLDNKIYVFGGLVKGTYSYTAVKDVFIYDTATETWRGITDDPPVAALPTATAYAAVAPTVSGKIWVMGGFTGSSQGTQQKIVQEYDPATNQWTQQPQMVKYRGGAAGISYRGKVYCLRGTKPYAANPAHYDAYADGEWFNPTSGYWSPSIMNYLGIYVAPTNALLRSGLFTSSPGQYMNKIYQLGGATGTASLYKYDYSNKVWAFPAPTKYSALAFLPILLMDD